MDAVAETSEADVVSDAPVEEVEAEASPEKPKRKPRARKPKVAKSEEVAVDAAPVVSEEAPAPVAAEPAPEPVVEAAPEPAPEPAPVPEPKSEPEVLASVEPTKPKRRGWWSLGK